MKTDLIKSSTEISRVAVVFNVSDIKLNDILVELYNFYGGVRFLLFPCEKDHIKTQFYNLLIKFDPDILVVLGDINKDLINKLNKTNPIKIVYDEKFKESFIQNDEILNAKDELPDILYENLSKVDKLLFPKNVYDKFKDGKYFLGKHTDYYDYIEKVFCNGLTQISGYYSHDNVNQDKSLDEFLIKHINDPLSNRFGLTEFYSRGYQCVIISENNIYDLCLYWNLRNYYWRKNFRENIIIIDREELVNLVDKLSNPSFFINIFSFSTPTQKLEKLKKELEEKNKDHEYFLKVNINPHTPIIFHTYINLLDSEEKIIIYENNKSQYLLNRSKLDISPLYLTKITTIDINNMSPMPISIQEYKDVTISFKKDAKVSADGIRILSSNSPYLYLQHIDSKDLITKILENRGYTVSLSDKGEIGLNVLRHFNKIQDIKVLYNKDIINLIKNYRGKIIDYETLNKLNIDISDLVKDRIILQGFALKCDSCKKINWSTVIDFKSVYVCQHCYDSIDLDIKYESKFKLNELFSLAYAQGVTLYVNIVEGSNFKEKFNYEIQYRI